jgi:hypothetical protein
MFSSVRLHELIERIAERFPHGGMTADDFRIASGTKTMRGTRRQLSELVKLKILDAVGAHYALTERAWDMHRNPTSSVDDEDVDEPNEAESEEPKPDAPAPSGPWYRAADGLQWRWAPDGTWWFIWGERPPRAYQRKTGHWLELVDGKVRWLRIDRWKRVLDSEGRVIDDAPMPPPPQPLVVQVPMAQPAVQQHPPVGQWHLGADGRQWLFDGQRYWTLNPYGRPVPA